jgi:hypothetical protein
MQLGDKLAIGSLPIGLGSLALGIGFPVLVPHLSPTMAEVLVWGGGAFIAAGLLFLMLAHLPWSRLHHLLPTARIPLREAARLAYEAGEGGLMEGVQDQIGGDTVEERTRRHVLNMLHRKLAMWGRSPPSKKMLRVLPELMWKYRWVPGSDAIQFVPPHTGGLIVDISVSRSDLSSYLAFNRRVKKYVI